MPLQDVPTVEMGCQEVDISWSH